jgi:hypothetical protein
MLKWSDEGRDASMQVLLATAALILTMVGSDALAQTKIPSSAMPGRERERFIDQPFPPTPRIQLQDGRPAPVIVPPDRKRPSKRKKSARGSRVR